MCECVCGTRDCQWVPALKGADNIDAYIGSRVRLRRVTLGVSQEQLGTALGLTFQQIQKYEKGQNRIGAGRLYRIAQALSAPVDYFFDGLPSTAPRGDEPGVIARSAEIQSFIASSDGHSLALAFQQIADLSTRKRIIDLITTIADDTVEIPG